MVETSAVEGADIAIELSALLSNESIEYIHIPNTKLGCFNCAVRRQGLSNTATYLRCSVELVSGALVVYKSFRRRK